MTHRFQGIVFALLIVVIVSPDHLLAAVVSNQLPTPVVEDLVRQGLWDDVSDDNPSGPESRALLSLLEGFRGGGDIRLSVEAMLDDHFALRPDPLYGIKVAILRGLLQYPQASVRLGYSMERLKKIEKAWGDRYLETAVATIQQAGVPEFNELLQDFIKQLRSGKIEIIDLSPANRSLLSQQLGFSHGQSLIEQREGHYLVQGAYFEGLQKLAGDFSRPIGETIVTLTHEIVHASDLEVRSAKIRFRELGEKVKQILGRSLAPNVSGELVGQVLDQVFYDVGRPELIGALSKNLTETVFNKNWLTGSHTPNENEEKVVRDWISALITSTVMNEFKAYSLSLLVYQGLKNFNVILPSGERDRLAMIIANGSGEFVQQLGLKMSPFMRSLKNYNQLVAKIDRENRLIIDHWLRYFEAIYLQELQSRIETASSRFSARLQMVHGTLPSSNSTSDWTRHGGVDSVTNPYTLITARVSTLWAIRMKQGVLGIVDRLRELANSVMALRAGILDLHDISSRELQMLQVIGPEGNPTELNQRLCGRSIFQGDVGESMANVYFPKAVWTPKSLLSENAISSSRLLNDLIKLRLLQSLGWLKITFPELKTNMIGAKVFLSKLREGLYDHEDLSPQRAREIESELGGALNSIDLTSMELGKVAYLNQFLLMAHHIVLDRRWSELQGEISDLRMSVLKTLDLMGVRIDRFDEQDFEKRWDKINEDFSESIEKIEDICSEVKAVMSVTNDSNVSLDGASIPIKYVCKSKETFLFRPPCDRAWVSSKIEGSQLLIRLLNGSRLIEGIPYQQLRK